METIDKENRRNPKEILIDNMDFSTRTYNCLRKVGCYTLEDLLSLSRKQLNNIRLMGQKSVEEIEYKLKYMGYEIGELYGQELSRQLPDASQQKNEDGELVVGDLFNGLIRDGFVALEVLESPLFEKGTETMLEISEIVEKYFNALVLEKLEDATNDEDFDKIETELSVLHAKYKAIVDDKRKMESIKPGFIAKMAAKNAELKKYHHNQNQTHEHTHNYNPYNEEFE